MSALSQTFYLGLSLLSLCSRCIDSHPQCLDFGPPFKAKEDLKMCSHYNDFGCCTREDDRKIDELYSKIMQHSFNDGPNDQCKDYLKDILCETCSPYAAHVFDAELNLKPNSFPGLCGSYCKAFYSQCRHLVPFITNDTDIVLSLNNDDLFCNQIAITDPLYCFPDVNVNNDLNKEIARETRNEDGCMCLKPFADRLRNPLAFRSSPDDTDRVFIAEQVGVVHIYYRNGTKIQTPFMDISHMVLSSANRGDERGFFNIAFHPNFADNQKFYVYFTIRHNGRLRTRVSEFMTSGRDQNQVDENSERVILEIPQPYDNHNGGELLFGVDGFLYITSGDGGAGNDPFNHGQNKSTLLGSVLRIDVNNRGSTKPYAIPPDNPFVSTPGARPEIYALGIRNTWRCDIDEGDPTTGSGQGRLICGDVGQGDWEEIDIINNGDNLGWAVKEGYECFKQSLCRDESVGPLVDPIYAYDHSVGQSVTGGHVYRGCENPNLQGEYVYGDFNVGKIFTLTEQSDGSWTNRQVSMCDTDICQSGLGLVNGYPRFILSFGEDANGEIYVLSTDNPRSTEPVGKVFKLVDPRRRGDPTECRMYIMENETPTTTEEPPTTTPTPEEPPTTKPTTTLTMLINSGPRQQANFRLSCVFVFVYIVVLVF